MMYGNLLKMMQEMGNSRARAVYEANLPDHFRRPQTDSSLEAFIRAKYEQKKYQAAGWVPPKPTVHVSIIIHLSCQKFLLVDLVLFLGLFD